MDNATFHKRADTQTILEQYGYKIVWLSTCSPDLNPIDERYITQGGHGSNVSIKSG